MPSRLESVAPQLAERFSAASAAARRAAATAASEYAIARLNIRQPIATLAIERLRAHPSALRGLHAAVNEVAESVDNAYLDLLNLQEERRPDVSEEAVTVRLFCEARALFSLAILLEDDVDVLAEAVYEAILAIDSPGDIARVMEPFIPPLH